MQVAAVTRERYPKMTKTKIPRVSIPTADQLRFMNDLMSWLDGLGMTLEDAEATVRECCSLYEGGAEPEQIMAFFRESHSVHDDDVHKVGDVAALLLFRGRLRRLKGGRYVHKDGRAKPHVFAVVRVPVEEWAGFQGAGYVLRSRAAFVAGPDDRA
jgi:hypothetical protein